MVEPSVLVSGLRMPESPRWHEGRLWFCNWVDRQVVTVELDGRTEVAVEDAVPPERPMGYSIDWLPDGRLLVTGDRLRVQEPDGSLVTYAEQGGNEIVVDGRGNIYVNGADFGMADVGDRPLTSTPPGYIRLVASDGSARQVAAAASPGINSSLPP